MPSLPLSHSHAPRPLPLYLPLPIVPLFPLPLAHLPCPPACSFIRVEHCDTRILTMELQLVRVEFCAADEGHITIPSTTSSPTSLAMGVHYIPFDEPSKCSLPLIPAYAATYPPISLPFLPPNPLGLWMPN